MYRLSMACISIFIVALAACGATPSRTSTTAEAASKDILQSDVDNLVAAGDTSVVADVYDHGITHKVSSGTAIRGQNVIVSLDAHYRTGSVTKTFVATVILQLVGEGRLALDDTVDRWLPGVIIGNGNDGTKITVRQLLQHTSGLFDYIGDDRFLATINTPESFAVNASHHYEPIDLVNLALSHPPTGTGFSYSNTNYVILGMIIQAVTSHSWDAEVVNRLVIPLGLTNTSIPGDIMTLPSAFSHGYNLWSAGVYTDTTQDNMTWASSAGSVITTTTDETKFFSALLSGQVLTPVLLTQMLTTIPIGSKFDYGLGIVHSTMCGKDLWWHDGLAFGYVTYVATLRDGSRTLALNETTSDAFGSDATFDRSIANARNVLVRHVFCGSTVTADVIPSQFRLLNDLK